MTTNAQDAQSTGVNRPHAGERVPGESDDELDIALGMEAIRREISTYLEAFILQKKHRKPRQGAHDHESNS